MLLSSTEFRTISERERERVELPAEQQRQNQSLLNQSLQVTVFTFLKTAFVVVWLDVMSLVLQRVKSTSIHFK